MFARRVRAYDSFKPAGTRFTCVECGKQDHADRNAAIYIVTKGLEKLNRNVPALKALSQRVEDATPGIGLCEPADRDPRHPSNPPYWW